MMLFLAEEGAQNPLIPDTAELIVGLLCFFIVFNTSPALFVVALCRFTGRR